VKEIRSATQSATCVEVAAPDGGAADAGVSTDAGMLSDDAALPI